MPCMTDLLYLKQPQPLSVFLPPVSGLLLMVAVEAQTRSCHACFNFAPGRWCCTRAVALMSPSSCRRDRSSWNIWMCSFKIYGIWPQARMLTHFRNAVPLVWGSLRLAPIICWFGVVTTEQFAHLQTSFVVLRSLLKSGCLRYNICRGEESHYILGTETFCRSCELFALGHVAREKDAGFVWTQQASKSH